MQSNVEHPWDEDGVKNALERKAADWLVLHDRGFTAQQRVEFERWLRADESHAEIYRELEETWSQLGRVREVASPVAGRTVPPRSRKPALIFTALAAAAAAIFVAVTWLQPAARVELFATTASTGIGVMRKLPLPDGSTVQLNTDSEINVQFTAAERRVRLVRGEAHFQVAKNPARPFIVSAGQVAVRAVGTAFDVRLRPQAVDVLVTEGKVRVNDLIDGRSLLAEPSSEAPPLLAAGQRVSIPVESAGKGTVASLPRVMVATVPVAEMSQLLAWQSKRLEFVSTPLADMVAEFNRYNRHQLVIADPRLAERRFGGTFAAGDYDELVRLLEADFGVVAERGETETKLRLAR
jgi:transmembrane sensor